MSIHNAKWVIETDGDDAPLFHKPFWTEQVSRAILEISALGWGEAYLNGRPVSDGLFTPAVSNYAPLAGRRLLYPLEDVFAQTRVYYNRYEVTHLLQEGENLLSVHVGNGFFNQTKRDVEGDFALGAPRLCYCLTLTMADGGRREIVSDSTTLAGKSYVLDNNLFYGERQDLSCAEGIHLPTYRGEMTPARAIEFDGFVLTLADFPADRVIRRLPPRRIGEVDGRTIYDVGENITGWIVLDTAYRGEIVLEFAEEITSDLHLDFASAGGEGQIQRMTYIGDGVRHTEVRPRFSWQGFRYFTVTGEVDNMECHVIHTDLARTGEFTCENEAVNLLLANYLRTQLGNLHGCVPSDCPHRERLGYTGDGQITCETVMHLFDARALYRKWMRDITDCQNRNNGHIQHTAPFFGGGGGPGGWGGAVIVLPYVYYKQYGDGDFVWENLSAMLRYLDYMESRCADGLVVCEEKDGWCLGDWCFENPHSDAALLPEPYVNTCYLVKFYDCLLELDGLLTLGLDTAAIAMRRTAHADAIVARYQRSDGNFCSGKVGANAFALDIGLGDERTFAHLADYYRRLGGFDTGIFGTEILVRLLTQRGEDELILRLLTSDVPGHSFGDAFRRGMTTIPEAWDLGGSHNHPMFGGCLKALFTCFLGIRNKGVGYDRVEIAPADLPELGSFAGHLTTPHGKIALSLTRTEQEITVKVKIPAGVEAEFAFRDTHCALPAGESVWRFD